MEEKGHKLPNSIGLFVGIAGLLVGLFGWLGITPEMVGNASYHIIHSALPFVMFVSGFLLGWTIRAHIVDVKIATEAAVEAEKQKGETERERMRYEHEEAERKHEQEAAEAERKRIRDKIFHLPTEQKALLMEAVMQGTAVVEAANDRMAAESLEKDGFLESLSSAGMFQKAWKATDFAQEYVNRGDHAVWANLRSAYSAVSCVADKDIGTLSSTASKASEMWSS